MTAFVGSDMVAVSSSYKRCSAAPVGISVAFRRRFELQVNLGRITKMKAVAILLAYLVAAVSCANQGSSSKDLATSSSVYYGYGSYGGPYGYSPYGGYAGGLVYGSPIYNGLGYGSYSRLGYGGLGYGGGGYYGGYGLGSGLGSGYGALNSIGGYGYGLGYGKLGYGGLGYGGFY